MLTPLIPCKITILKGEYFLLDRAFDWKFIVQDDKKLLNNKISGKKSQKLVMHDIEEYYN